jgi:hypothetical protein
MTRETSYFEGAVIHEAACHAGADAIVTPTEMVRILSVSRQ